MSNVRTDVSTAVVLEDIAVERRNQINKWGYQTHPDLLDERASNRADYGWLSGVYRDRNDQAEVQDELDWTGILLEEVYEALAESDRERIRAELVQVAAVAVAWIEDIDSERLAGAHEMTEPEQIAGYKWHSRCTNCDYETPITTSSRVLDLIEKHEGGETVTRTLWSRTSGGEKYVIGRSFAPFASEEDLENGGWVPTGVEQVTA